MAVNDLTFNQLASVMNSIVSQATGKTAIAATNSYEFTTAGQTALKTGYDPVIGAISQIMKGTIFSTRPYSAKFKGMQVSNQRFGNWMRKLAISDKDWAEDDRTKLVDGASVDMYPVNVPNVLQLNFYGANVYSRYYTIFRDQLDCAFQNEQEFQSFLTMMVQNVSDMIEQAHESMARMTLANFIGGKVEGDSDSVFHLLTEYNTATGLALTDVTVYLPENFRPFMQWVYAFIATISSRMTERTRKYQIHVTGKELTRHTPMQNQRVYLFAPARFQSETMALADTFHDNYLRLADTETVNFWQSIDTPDSINVKSIYLHTDGTLKSPAAAVTTAKIFGVLMDENAAGYTVVNQWSHPTPFNARGGYSDIWYHFTDRYINDFTEKGVILLLD